MVYNMPNTEDIKNFIIEGYRNILKRGPDLSGFNHYFNEIHSGKISKETFLEILRTSEEYKIKTSKPISDWRLSISPVIDDPRIYSEIQESTVKYVLNRYGYLPPNGKGEFASIIIANLNGIKYTKALLESIYRKTTNFLFEIIIVDDCSDKAENDDEELRKLVEEILPYELTVIFLNKRSGFSIAINEGIRIAKGNYILIINNDTEIITDNWLQKLVSVANIDPKIGIVGMQSLYPDGLVQHAGGIIDKNGNTEHLYSGQYPNENTNKIYEVDYISVAMLIKRDIINMVGGFDFKTFDIYYEDVDYCTRVRRLGYKIVYCGDVKIMHHEGMTIRKVNPKITPKSTFVNKWNDIFEISNIEEIKNFVTEGYRDILKREPDPIGLERHIRLIQTGTISKETFLDALRNSEEYKERI